MQSGLPSVAHGAIAAGLLLAAGNPAAQGAGAPATGQEIRLFHAGSLNAAWTQLVDAVKRDLGITIVRTSGASGTLRERLEKGEAADLFTSADLGHPMSLGKAGLAGPTMLYARNTLCAYARPNVGLRQANFLERILDPNVKVATSTPVADPAGDYTWEMFRKADKLTPGAYSKLDAKAMQPTKVAALGLTVPQGRNPATYHIEQSAVDIYILYCSGGADMKRDYPQMVTVTLPTDLSVGAEYGMAILKGARLEAATVAAYILSVQGQQILAHNGFSTVTMPAETAQK